jgi:hypothetical protein
MYGPAVRCKKELNDDYEAAVGLNVQPSKVALRQKYLDHCA